MIEQTLPRGWAASTLGALSEYITSGSRDWSSYYASTGSLFIRTQDINKNRIGDLDSVARVSLPSSVEGKRSLVLQDDLLVTITGANVGRCAHVAAQLPEAYVSQSVALVRLQMPSLARFIHYQLLAPLDSGEQTWLEANAYGMGRPVLSLENVRSVPLRIAPVAERQRIADKLDTVLSRVDACHDRLARVAPLLKRFRQSVLAAATSGRLTEDWRDDAAMPWKPMRRTLADLAEVVTGSTPSKKEPANFGDAVPFFKPSDLDQGYAVTEATEYLSATGAQLARVLPAQAVLVTCIGATIGKTGLARVSCTTNQQINALVTRPALVLPAWLYFWCCSPIGQQAIIKNSSATTLPILNKSRFSALEAEVPALAEQAEIVCRIETLFAFADRLEARLAQAQTAVDRLTPSLLAKAFRGELVPQDPADEPAAEFLKRLAASRSAPAPKTRKPRQGQPA